MLLLLLACAQPEPLIPRGVPMVPVVATAAAATPSPTASSDPCQPGWDAPAGAWTPIAPGVEHAWLRFDPPPAIGCNRLDVVRVDPATAHLSAGMRSLPGGTLHTAMDWCTKLGAAVTINLGMFETDFVTHTGYLRAGEHTNNARWVGSYKSALWWDDGHAAMVDLESPGSNAFPAAQGVVQNLRLISAPGRALWAENGKQWSEAGLAQDDKGRLLLLHTRAAFSMADLTRRLVAMPLGVQRAMHLEGGPEASLAICAEGHRLEAVGSYETGFFDDRNREAWPLPNVLAVR